MDIIVKAIIFFLLLSKLCDAQTKFVDFKDLGYGNKKVLDSIVTSYQQQHIDSILVFTTLLYDLSTLYNNDENREKLFFLIYQFKGKVFVRFITFNCIYNTIELINSKIFDYKYLKETAVTIDEAKLKVSAPLEYSFSDVVFYITKNVKFYFEYGQPISYGPNDKKDKYRKEWTNTIRGELISKLADFKVERCYSGK